MKRIKIGTRVERKRDGVRAKVSATWLAVPAVAHPGIFGKTLVTLVYENGERDASGDLSWVKSNFKVLD